jgi:hypothetical protein
MSSTNTVIDATRAFFERGGADRHTRLRRLIRTPSIEPEIGICYGCHRVMALNQQRRCFRCVNCPGKPRS